MSPVHKFRLQLLNVPHRYAQVGHTPHYVRVGGAPVDLAHHRLICLELGQRLTHVPNIPELDRTLRASSGKEVLVKG